MKRYIIHPHRWTRMQDAGLARSEFLAGQELERRSRTGSPERPDRRVLAEFLGRLAAEFATAWAAARERRGALRALKRVDRRLLRDLGIERAQLREVVDAMAARQAEAERRHSATAQQPCMLDDSWTQARAAG